MYTGAERYLIVAKETTFGTAGTTKAYARVTQFGVKGTPEYKRLDEHLGQPDHVGHVTNKLNVAGPIGGLAYGIGASPVVSDGAVPLEQWWDWAYTRTSAQLQSITGEWSGGDDPRQLLGLRFNSFELAGDADSGQITWQGQVVGQDDKTLASATSVPDPDPYGSSSSTDRRAGPMMYQMAATLFEVDDVQKRMFSWKLSLQNKLIQSWLGTKSVGFTKCQMLDQTKPTCRELTGEIKVRYDDTFYTAKLRADTPFKLELAAQGYKNATTDRRVVFTLRGSVASDYNPEEAVDALGMLTVPLIFEKVGANPIADPVWSDVAV